MILRIHTSKSVKETIHYHTGNKSEAEYYSSDGQEFAGCWGGKGAEMLGLSGRVTDEAFARLASNRHPVTGEKLTPRMRADRRPGFDCNFNVPKSVSLLYAWTKDERIIRALRQAQLDTLLEMQEMAATRVRAKGRKDGDRKTGVLAWAEIIHLTARPEGGIPDPHLHSHCYVFNATWDDVEKKWKALQMGLINDEADYYDRAAAMRLAANLKALGLEIVPTKDAFEIAGISRDLIEKFSRRTKTIEEYAEKRGITDPVEKAKIAALTRERKSKSLLISELEPFWWDNLLPEEIKALDANKMLLQRSLAVELGQQMTGRAIEGDTSSKAFGTRETLPAGKTKEIGASSDFLGTKKEMKSGTAGRRQSMNQKTKPIQSVNKPVKVTEDERRAVALAIEHTFERASVVTEKQLFAEASRNWCIHRTSIEGIKAAIAEAPLIRREWNGSLFVTTEQVLAEEKRIAGRCIAGKGKCEPMNEFWRIEDKKLSDEQQTAVMHVLNSTDWITGIAGRAGVGKTTLLHEVRRGIQSGMNKLIALAPTSEAARDVLRKEGFDNAETVAKLLRSERLQREARGAVWLVDEAGLLSTRDADRLLDLANKLGARLVLVGDTGQHHPVERGQAFDHLRKEGKMEVAEVTKIQRQKGIHKRFVEQVYAGDIPAAIKTLKELDWVFEMTLDERKIALARDYISAIEHGNTALVVAPTHAECADVTEGIRDALKEKNVLKNGKEWDVLRNLSWTDAQKSDSDQYKRGQVVQINGHVNGFALGEQVEVIGVREGIVRVRCKDGYNSNIRALPLSEPETFSVYERAKMEICEGDRLRITGNGRTADKHPLNNKSVYTVDYFDHDGRIVLENGWKIDRDFKHLDYGYTLTSHAAQGKTVDWVFVAQSAQLSSCASDLKQFYVSTSRGRKGVKLYVDDLELLEENVSRRRERPMATEMLRGDMESEEAAEFQAESGESNEMKISESLGKTDAAKLEIEPELREGMDKALDMAYPISEQEAAETLRQMEEAEAEHELEMELD
ncbi:MAG: MobF family relaxase [Verrucomicrobiota bacterium]|jgi:conjugative relaxase-like TrwC/TraI family protein